MDTTAVVEPPLLLAVTVYSVADCTVVGVPEITPVVVFIVNPVGNVGLTDHAVTVPVTDGTLFAITASFV
jgi:hypothetical protein